MKKIIIILFLVLSLISCNLNTNQTKMEKTVQKWDKIAVSYTWKLTDGTIFDSTAKHWGKFLEFTAWAGQMIPWFDKAVIWMKLWEEKTITIPAKEAYWEKDESKKQIIAKKDLASFTAAWFKLEKWEKLPTQYWEFEIVDTDKDTVTLDMNHPLAWKDLIFDIKIEKIEDK